MTTTKCNACGNAWNGAKSYCPRCGSPVLAGAGSHRILEIAVVIAAVVVLVWLTAKYK